MPAPYTTERIARQIPPLMRRINRLEAVEVPHNTNQPIVVHGATTSSCFASNGSGSLFLFQRDSGWHVIYSEVGHGTGSIGYNGSDLFTIAPLSAGHYGFYVLPNDLSTATRYDVDNNSGETYEYLALVGSSILMGVEVPGFTGAQDLRAWGLTGGGLGTDIDGAFTPSDSLDGIFALVNPPDVSYAYALTRLRISGIRTWTVRRYSDTAFIDDLEIDPGVTASLDSPAIAVDNSGMLYFFDDPSPFTRHRMRVYEYATGGLIQTYIWAPSHSITDHIGLRSHFKSATVTRDGTIYCIVNELTLTGYQDMVYILGAGDQTEFFRYPTKLVAEAESLGTPDGGNTVPVNTSFDTDSSGHKMFVRSNPISDMRLAIQLLAPSYINPATGNPYNWGPSSLDNLYYVYSGTTPPDPGPDTWQADISEHARITDLSIAEIDGVIAVLEASDHV